MPGTSVPRLFARFESPSQLEREYADRLRRGFVVATGAVPLAEGSPCEVVLLHPSTGETLAFAARVTRGSSDRRFLCALEGFGAAMAQRLEGFARPGPRREVVSLPIDVGSPLRVDAPAVPISVGPPLRVDALSVAVDVGPPLRAGSVDGVIDDGPPRPEDASAVDIDVGPLEIDAGPPPRDEGSWEAGGGLVGHGEIEEMDEEGDPAGDGDGEDGDDPHLIRPKIPAHALQRLRSLPMHEVLKVARSGNLPERVALERIYGKTVWEPLLQNVNLTPPEVARIARMGTLPKPLIEVIVARAGWLSKSIIRRALLSNPRLSGRSLVAVLRALPKAELKLVPQQSAYPYKVRQEAARLLGT